MSFVRVRSVDGALHEFDAPVALVAAFPDRYKVLDKSPVSEPCPEKHVTRPARKRSGSKSVGESTKEKPDGI